MYKQPPFNEKKKLKFIINLVFRKIQAYFYHSANTIHNGIFMCCLSRSWASAVINFVISCLLVT